MQSAASCCTQRAHVPLLWTNNMFPHNSCNCAFDRPLQKKSQLEHILLRPDTYIGSTEKQQQQLWVHDGDRMVMQNTSYVPGLYKIFDEILVNAADNKVRDPSMDTLRVSIDEVSESASAECACSFQACLGL